MTCHSLPFPQPNPICKHLAIFPSTKPKETSGPPRSRIPMSPNIGIRNPGPNRKWAWQWAWSRPPPPPEVEWTWPTPPPPGSHSPCHPEPGTEIRHPGWAPIGTGSGRGSGCGLAPQTGSRGGRGLRVPIPHVTQNRERGSGNRGGLPLDSLAHPEPKCHSTRINSIHLGHVSNRKWS